MDTNNTYPKNRRMQTSDLVFSPDIPKALINDYLFRSAVRNECADRGDIDPCVALGVRQSTTCPKDGQATELDQATRDRWPIRQSTTQHIPIRHTLQHWIPKWPPIERWG